MPWTERVPDDIVQELIPICEDMVKLTEVTIPRYPFRSKLPMSERKLVLISLSDASEGMIGASCYLVQCRKTDWEEYEAKLQAEGELTKEYLATKESPPEAPEKRVFGEVCRACEQDEEHFKKTGELPREWWIIDQSRHTHTVLGKPSKHIGKWLQEQAVAQFPHQEVLGSAEKILGAGYAPELEKLMRSASNQVCHLMSRQKVQSAQSVNSIPYGELAG